MLAAVVPLPCSPREKLIVVYSALPGLRLAASLVTSSAQPLTCARPGVIPSCNYRLLFLSERFPAAWGGLTMAFGARHVRTGT